MLGCLFVALIFVCLLCLLVCRIFLFMFKLLQEQFWLFASHLMMDESELGKSCAKSDLAAPALYFDVNDFMKV